MTASELARFEAKVELIPFSSCWEWVGVITPKGYGRFPVGSRSDKSSRSVRAHRISYEHHVGPIPEGLTIDHLCRNRSCVNPAHLEPVTNKENVLRGVGLSAQHARKTHCKRGHPFDGHNTYHRPNKIERECRACQKIWRRESRERRAHR